MKCVIFLLVLLSPCYLAAQSYTISQAQMDALYSNLVRLEQARSTLDAALIASLESIKIMEIDLSVQKANLNKASSEIIALRINCDDLAMELAIAKGQAETLRTQLLKSEQSLILSKAGNILAIAGAGIGGIIFGIVVSLLVH